MVGLSHLCFNQCCSHHLLHTYTNNCSTFQRKDAFIGYRDDTPAAVVFQANHLFHKLVQGMKGKSLEWIRVDDAAVFDADMLSDITSCDGEMESEKLISSVRTL